MAIKSLERKKQILEAASNCFSNNGFHKTSMQDICKEANMSPGSLYRYFNSKEDMIVAMADQESAEKLALLEILIDSNNFIKSLSEHIRKVLSRMLDRKFANLFVEITAETNRNAEIREMLITISKKVIMSYKSAIERAQENGKIKSSIDAELAAQLIISIIDGLVFRSLVISISLDSAMKQIDILLTSWLKPQSV